MTKKFDKQNGRLDWSEISRHPNTKACKPWIAEVCDYDEDDYKYNWDQEFLGKSEIDGNHMIDVSELVEGDVIRVSGASHKNDKKQCWRVEDNSGDDIEVSKVSESEVIDIVQSDDKTAKQELIELVQGMNDEEAEKALMELSGVAVVHNI
ncbi:hypothetical protein [Halobacterium salinarum]|uniref:hypothetical protein n=1 Tax=Halobacterium salinarum TaxID=2242 RepID=UPI002556CD54|nr:hypothetical protein [Halobacterium salinarum]MDL0144536.1 hypothetical protein [Halobacterium salinarum]